MDKPEKMPMWRKVLIAICSLLIIACLILVGNIKSIITREELVKCEPSKVFQNDVILKSLLEFNELRAQPTNPVGVCRPLTQKYVAKRYIIAEKLLPLHHESQQQYEKYV